MGTEWSRSVVSLCDPMDCSLPGSSVHGILQARILKWVAISFSRGSSQPRVGELRSLKMRRQKKKKKKWRLPRWVSDFLPPDLMLLVAMKSCYFSFRPRVSSYLENKPKNPHELYSPLQCSGTGSDSLQRLLNDCGNWKSWERKLQFFDSFLEAVSIFHFPTLIPLSCHVWFASFSAHNIFDIIFGLN